MSTTPAAAPSATVSPAQTGRPGSPPPGTASTLVPDPFGGPPVGAVRTFHPRRGRLSPQQQDAIDRLWPAYGGRVDGTPLDLAARFGNDNPVVLEIGFGMGEATAAKAAADPGTNNQATDNHTPGLGNLLHHVAREGLTNVRIVEGDAVALLTEMIPADALAGIRVYFPDPWPKSRHHKRRLIRPGFVAMAASRLAPGGTLHCATDWAPYAAWMLEVLEAEPALSNTAGPGGGFAPRPEWRPMTRFERQGLAKGHPVADLIFRRA
ncbi:tRNA (guanosine(46)-N7)-methyltransferase TrmB [Yinghuangia seranimata]|uniref:tRNA (guanosine(46)-N7)-methyltransferase TrmB n=1 Tax=Yinghuangia seranimata TaxID=408067 RepID=UPI00248AEFCA|nr:tRNA (guanosine(46)-N7)-methyltransferase TrmB [Yinghuangia seranimata]MDI2132661.1 tRNA (guanosine(46)-N7)-methyltransferase TrmB [Yinghuangia seranimata]